MANLTKKERRIRRKAHIRKNVSGTSERPRVFVFKSNRYFYAGIADDEKNIVIKSFVSKKNEKDIMEMTKKFVDEAKKFNSLVFDRSGYKYHGLIQKFVDELRKEGIKI
ncbi:MAG TPA: 50S ribosomal protein L18 [Candidatus Dojkabacteria bacterium]|nr:50S ribosomal protein L18 [Candidatus Dojkabacteria bacterium]